MASKEDLAYQPVDEVVQLGFRRGVELAGESAMAMGRSGALQDDLMATWAEMPRSPGHAFYDRLQDLLSEAGFDAFVEGVCKPHYAPRMGAPSLPPGRYFRMHWSGPLSIVCGRPVGCKGFFARIRQCGQALSCVRPRDAAVHLPRARMEVRGPGPSRRRALEALRLTLVFPIPSH